MEVDQPLPSSEDEDGEFDKYFRSETTEWMEKEADAYWESLDEAQKQEFLTVFIDELVFFSQRIIEVPWLVDFLPGAIAFFQLHGTWEMYVCPDQACLRLFKDSESLIGHLKCDHFSKIYPVAWPPSRHNLPEEQLFANALRKMVWKPIDVEPALNLLTTMCLDYNYATLADVCAGCDQLESVNWPFADDVKRNHLLVQLKEGFQVLLAQQEQASFSLISDGLFMKMTALASKHIFMGLGCPPRGNLSALQSFLSHSPLSFCLLETKYLFRFVELVKVMCQSVRQNTLCSADRELDCAKGDLIWRNNVVLEAHSTLLDAVSVKMGSLDYGGGKSPLYPLCQVSPIPSIQKIPKEAAAIFSHLQEKLECLREVPSVSRLSDRFSSACIAFGPPNIPQLGLAAAAKLSKKKKIKNKKNRKNRKNIRRDSVSSEIGENFNPGCTSHLPLEPRCCYGNPDKLNCIDSHFEGELHRIQLVNELQHLEPLLCQHCAINFHMYICQLIGSLLRLKLYIRMRHGELDTGGGSPVAQRNVSSDISESEYHCDYETYESDETGFGEGSDGEDAIKSDVESKYDDKPWRTNLTLCKLDSTLSESMTGGNEGTGPFFWMALSDLRRHCLKNLCNPGYESVLEGIRWLRLNKTWKYWLCHCCGETFTDRETHMVHLEDKHQLCVDYNDCWLIPKRNSGEVEEEWRRDVVKREPALEDSITLDQTFCYFLVDSTNQMLSTHVEEELGQAKCKEYMEIVDDLHSQLRDLRHIFQKKREYLTDLQVVDALCHLYGDQPFALVNLLLKLSSTSWFTGTTSQLKSQFCSELISEAGDERHYPFSECSVQKAFQNMRHDLTYQIECQDTKILEALVRINDVKGILSEHCVCDYRTKIVPSVRSFLHSKFRFDDSLTSLGCNKIKELLTSIKRIKGSEPYEVVVHSPGKVIINTKKNKSWWGFAFIGIRLKFVGGKEKTSGDFTFGGLFPWGEGAYDHFEYIKPHDPGTYRPSSNLGLYFSIAISDRFLLLVEQIIEEL